MKPLNNKLDTVKPRNLLILGPSIIVPQIASVIVCIKWDQMAYNRVIHRRLRGRRLRGFTVLTK